MAVCLVLSEWIASYENPFAVGEGEEIWLTEKEIQWEGHIWIWAKDSSGREGWVPDDLASHLDGITCARFSFSALELTCYRGEELLIIDETHGWVLCQNVNGQAGWVPAKNLRKADDLGNPE